MVMTQMMMAASLMMMLIMFEKHCHATRNPRQSANQRLAYLSSPCIAAPALPSNGPTAHLLVSFNSAPPILLLSLQLVILLRLAGRARWSDWQHNRQEFQALGCVVNSTFWSQHPAAEYRQRARELMPRKGGRGATARMSGCAAIVLQWLFSTEIAPVDFPMLRKTHIRGHHIRGHATNVPSKLAVSSSQAQSRSRIAPGRSYAALPAKTPSGENHSKASVLDTS